MSNAGALRAALIAVLPYAETECAALQEMAHDEPGAEIEREAREAHAALVLAWRALGTPVA